MKKVIILYGKSKYNYAEFTAMYIKDILISQGCNVDALLMKYDRDQMKLMDMNPDLLITIDMIGFQIETIGGEPNYNNFYVPMINFLNEIPLSFDKYLDGRLNFTMNFFSLYDEDIKFIDEFYPRVLNKKCINSFGFETQFNKEYDKREIDVYYPTTYIPSESLKGQLKQLSQGFQILSNNVIEIMDSDCNIYFYDALKKSLNDMNIKYSSIEFKEISKLLMVILPYLKMKKIEEILDVCLKNNIHIAVSGNGWNEYKNRNDKNFTQIGDNGLEYKEMLRTMGNSKIVINNQIHKRGNIHPRVINAMLQGAVCISDENRNIGYHFQNNIDCLLYSNKKVGSMISKMNEVLKNDDLGNKISLNGYKNAKEFFSLINNIEIEKYFK